MKKTIKASQQKIPVLLLSNDWHLERENIEQIMYLVQQMCDVADNYKLDLLAVLGDVFDKRKMGQEQSVLIALENILDYILSRKKTLVLFPGNHDKTDYESSDSFLQPFRYHPAVKFFNEPSVINIGSVDGSIECFIMPYYSPLVYKQKLELLVTSNQRKKILLSHIDLTGSVNNDGSEIKNCLSKNDFEPFDLVLLGHYHNHQIIGNKIVHLPSICQNNFGEDTNKGFTILYDDLSWEIVRSKFKEFKKMFIHVKDVINGGIKKMLTDYDSSNMNIRFIVSGSQEEVKSLDITDLESKYGVDIQIQSDEINSSIEFVEKEEITEFNEITIRDAFQEFCNERNFNYEEGNKYLNLTLNARN